MVYSPFSRDVDHAVPVPELMTKQETRLYRAVPALAAPDATLEALWRALAEQCGVDAITYQRLSISACTRSYLRAREEQRYEYESAADLHHAPPSLRVVRK